LVGGSLRLLQSHEEQAEDPLLRFDGDVGAGEAPGARDLRLAGGARGSRADRTALREAALDPERARGGRARGASALASLVALTSPRRKSSSGERLPISRRRIIRGRERRAPGREPRTEADARRARREDRRAVARDRGAG